MNVTGHWRKGHPKSVLKPGTPPGELIQPPESHAPVVAVMGINQDELFEREIEDFSELKNIIGKYPATWVHVSGLGDTAKLRELAQLFELHPLAMEDVTVRNQQTKIDEYANHLFIVMRMPVHNEESATQQLNIFLGPNYVITFQEKFIGYLDPIRQRIREKPRRRFVKADYLTYSIIDTIIDGYLPILEEFGEILTNYEKEIITEPDRHTLQEIYSIKRELQELRRAVWPQRDTVTVMLREQTRFITDETRIYLRDCYDHAVHLMELCESYREFSSDLVNLYMTRISNDMNAIMKVLTIIATIFIPLGFIAGVYGMNFNTQKSPWNMPELNWYCGYPFSILLMTLTAIGLLIYFKWRKWL